MDDLRTVFHLPINDAAKKVRKKRHALAHPRQKEQKQQEQKHVERNFFCLGFFGCTYLGAIYCLFFLLGDRFGGVSLKTHRLPHCPLSVLQIKQLGLCVTVLKQKCREFGIVRWPFRKVKKIDMLIKQLEEEKEKVVSSSSVSGKEEEPPRGLKEQQGEERGGNFVVVGAPTRKVILEDIENRLQEMLKMRDELYADPNSNIHLLPNSTGSAINSNGGLTAEKRGESNNTRSPSRQQAKAAKAAAAANAVQKHQLQLQEKSTEKDDDDNGAEKKKSTTATVATNTEMKIAESTHTSQESDERRADVVQIDDEFSLSAPTEEEKKKKGKSFSTGRLWQRKERVIEKATAATPTRPTLKRQGSNSCSGKDSGLLFDALLDAATALDTTKKNGGKGEQVSGDENKNVINNSDDYEWGRNTENEAGQDESIIGSPRKVRRSCDVQRSVRPPSSDISREKKGLEPRPNSAPLNMNNISEADVAAAFYQQMQLQHVQNTAAAVAAMQAAMATSMNPSQQSIPLMYQVPYSLQYMNLNSNMMQVQWAEMNKNINATAATATNTAGMSLLERRAAEAAASIGGGNVAMPSSLDLKIPTASREGSTHSGTYFPYYGGGMYSPRQYHHYQQQQMISMPVVDQSAASDGNSSLETGGVYTAEDKNIRGSGVASPSSIGAFPSSNRVSFEDMTEHPSPISPTNTTAGIHRPVALKRGHLELQSNQFI